MRLLDNPWPESANGPPCARRPRVRALALSALVAAGAASAQLAGLPPAQEAPVLPLLGDAPSVAAEDAPVVLSAAERAARLKAHPLHGERFFVEGVVGDAAATKVVLLIPQFHRSSTSPLAWSSVGRAIADVQANIETTLTVLARTQGVLCVGTEGSAAEHIPESFELKRLAFWREDLRFAEDAAAKALRGEERDRADDLEALRIVLESALQERASVLDGVGAAQARLHGEVAFDRFGVEDAELNARAVALVRARDALDRQLGELEVSTLSDVQSALGQMWVAEYPLYREATVAPLLAGLDDLEDERRSLMRAGADDPARELARYLSLVRRIAADAIQPDEVEATYAYYRGVADRLADGGAGESGPSRGPLSKSERRQKKKLEKDRAKLMARYRKIAHDERNRVAALRVLERVNRPEHEACALVFGQGHQESITKALVDLGKKTGLGPVGVVVVSPYDLSSE